MMMEEKMKIGKLHLKLPWKKGKRRKVLERWKTGGMGLQEEWIEEEEAEWRDAEDGLTTTEDEEE